MQLIQQIADRPNVRAALEMFNHDITQAVSQIEQIQQVPAPTFAEGERAAYVEGIFQELGLLDIRQDDLHNVYGRMAGKVSGAGPAVVLSAHLDTVFPAATNLGLKRENGRVHGPGIADNSAGVGGMIAAIRAMNQFDIVPDQDIYFVANVGEEGLGDLNGMRAVVDYFGSQPRYIILEGGLFGQILHRAIAVQRFMISVTTGGGHSWKNFGRPSAIHILGQIITRISNLSVPTQPFTTYNVGLIEGGTSINTVAPEARLWLDLRSEMNEPLAALLGKVREIVAQANEQPSVEVAMAQIGDRPAGQIAQDANLIQMAAASLRAVGLKQVNYTSGSTDANIPLSRGYQAVCIGLAKADNVHRLDEYLETEFLARGLGQLLLLTLAAATPA